MTVNDKDINIDEIVKKYGKDKISAILYLHDLANIKWDEAKQIINSEYKKYPEYNKKEEKKDEKPSWDELERKYCDTPMSDVARCPKCGSTSITVVKKGFGFGKAFAGSLLVGPVGLFAGGIGANKVQRVCLSCGHKW